MPAIRFPCASQREHADVSLIALEEERVVAFRSDFVDLAVIAGGDVEISCLVEYQIPDVFRSRREVDGRTPRRIERRLGGIFRALSAGLLSALGASLFPGLVLDLVDLAVGSSGRVDHAARANLERLHLQFLRLEDDRRLAVGSDAIDARRRSSRGVDVSRIIGGDRPDVGGRRGIEQLERWREFETSGAADGDSVGRTLDQIVELGLLPGARAFGE